MFFEKHALFKQKGFWNYVALGRSESASCASGLLQLAA
jgi:hypothetical protein